VVVPVDLTVVAVRIPRTAPKKEAEKTTKNVIVNAIENEIANARIVKTARSTPSLVLVHVREKDDANQTVSEIANMTMNVHADGLVLVAVDAETTENFTEVKDVSVAEN
jgi:hypothetical protein